MSGRISDLMTNNPTKPPSAPERRSTKLAAEVGIKDISTDEYNEVDSCAVTVAVRVRPFAKREENDSTNRRVVCMRGCETQVQANETSPVHKFQYDYSFDSFDRSSPGFSSQAKVYECLAQPLLNRAFQGYNTCLFAYGQTGSGKSYSIMGHGDEDGIIPRFAEELFEEVKSLEVDNNDVSGVTVETSFFEIYNERIHDLLAVSKGGQSTDKTSLRVREHPEQGPYVEGLSTYPVASFHDIVKLLTLGNRQRATASTGMNDKSSRSHSVFTLHLRQLKRMEFEETLHEHSVYSRISLVDLAGSERQSSAHTTGVRLKEGASINKSLLTLGKVISVLAEQSSQVKKRKLFVPYRDSVLTWLLRESLGGNARTAMLATISPSLLNIEETLSTLRYAQQARSIINLAKVNEDPKARLIRELRAEIEKLRAEQSGEDVDTLQEILSLRKALQEKEMDMELKLRDWQQKLALAEEKLRQESSALEHTGVAATSVNNQLPNLVNLNEDPQLSEMLLYVLKQGRTKVGRQGALNQECDIQLSGALVSDYHCELVNEQGVVSLAPVDKDAPTFVNGQQILEPLVLQHGDRVVIGGDHYFRFNCPASVDPAKRKSSVVPKDFLFAKNEIENVQNARLEEERAKIQNELERQMAEQLQEVETNYNQQLKDQRLEFESRLHKIQSDLLRQRTQPPKLAEPTTVSCEHVLSSLKAEKLKLTESHERMRPKLRTARAARQEHAVKSIASVPSERNKTDLYKVALLIREANKISQIKSLPVTFAQEEIDNVIVVKVTDRDLDRYTYLTVAKFEERLTEMREALNNDETHEESMAIFCNPRDSWRSSTDPQPLQPARLDDILNSENNLSSMELVISPPADSKVKQRSRTNGLHAIGLFSMCKDFVSYSLQLHKGSSVKAQKVFDSILRQCELCKIAVQSLSSKYKHQSSSQQESAAGEVAGACCLQLVSSSEVLLEQCQLCSSMCEDIESEHIAHTVGRMSELSLKISRIIIQLMQALSSCIAKAVEDSSASLTTTLLEMCKLCGVMSLATDTTLSMQSDDPLQLSKEVQISCTKGALEQCVYTAGEKYKSVHDSIEYMDKGVKSSFASTAIYNGVHRALEEVQSFLTSYKEEAMATLNTMGSTQSEFDSCQKYDSCTQAMSNMGTIGDSLSALTKPMFTQGKEYDRAIMLKAANTIKRCCRNISSDTSLGTTSLVNAVNQLFTVTEAEGKVKVHHKSAEPVACRQVKRLLPQVSSVEKVKRVLPPSPETGSPTMSPFTTSPPKSVQKLTAIFEGGPR